MGLIKFMEETKMSFHASNYSNTSVPTEGTIRSFAEKLTLSVVRKYRAHKTSVALSALSDAELSDIGISRGEIPAISSRLSV
jgi:uncharacterized protein YjiS (DUF1127 family)